jgi:hypothetical protein
MNAYNGFPQLGIDGTTIYFAGGKDVARFDTATNSLVVLASQQQVGGMAIGGRIFWTNAFQPGGTGDTGSVNAIGGSGGPVSTLASHLHFPGQLAVDDQNAYWVDSLESISMVALTGGSASALVENQQGINGLAARNGFVYWTNYAGQISTCGVCPPPPPPTLGDGTLNRIAVSGGATTVLSKGYGAGAAVLDAKYVYWTDGTTIEAVPVAGGPALVLASDGVWVGPVVDQCNVYWIAGDKRTIKRVAKPT